MNGGAAPKDRAYLRFSGVTKRFPGVVALSGMSFHVAEGSVHALVGENGAGKSTLLKILSGHHACDEGGLEIAGRPVSLRTAGAAFASGVAVIHQELQLVGDMTVAENIYLGNMPRRFGLIKRRELLASARAQLAALKEDIDPEAKVRDLPIAKRQMVEIAKALSRGAKILAFDEPTSSLSEPEIRSLFAQIQTLKENGCALLYVSHRMEEIFALCDAATVLRDGKHVRTYSHMRDLTPEQLVRDMVGRDIQDVYSYRVREHGAPVLEVKELRAPGLRGASSFTVAKGEVLGLFGLVGAGRTELLEAVYGHRPISSGEIKVAGVAVTMPSTRAAIEHGVMLCPEDRKGAGIVQLASVQDNINLSARRHHMHLGCVINERWERRNAAEKSARLGVKISSLDQPIKHLSGGNQQKVILARWLSETVKVMLLDEPTRGIDVAAKHEIYTIIYQLAAKGAGVVVVSADLPEILGICDRILVMREGRIAASLLRADATAEAVLSLALPGQAHERTEH